METSPDANRDDTAPVKRRRGAVAHVARICLLVIGAPVVLAVLIPILMIGQQITAPSWITRQVEAQAGDVLGGGRIAFREITVTIARDLHPTVEMHDTQIFDAGGALLARVPVVSALVSPRGLLLEQRVLPQEIILRGARADIQRAASGRVAIAFEHAQLRPDTTPDLARLLNGFDTAFDTPALEALERIEARGMILNYEDARSGRYWTVDGAGFQMEIEPESFEIDGAMSVLSGRDYVTDLRVSYDAQRGAGAADLAVSITDVVAQDIATQSAALSWLSVFDGRVSADLRLRVDEASGLGPVFAVVDIADGAFRPETAVDPIGFDRAKAYLTYDPRDARISFEELSVTGDWGGFQVQGQALLQDLDNGLPSGLVAQFETRDMSLALPGVYAQPLEIARAGVDFQLRLQPFSIEVGQAYVTTQDVDISGVGRAAVEDAGWTVAADVVASDLQFERLLALWPVDAARGARTWVDENWTAGVISGLTAAVRMTPDTPVEWALHSGFDASSFRVMRQLPLVQDSAGTLVLQQGGFGLRLEAGEMRLPQGGAIDLAGSTFDIPKLEGPLAPAQITLMTDSTIEAMLTLLDMPPFEVLRRAGREVDLARGNVTARGQIDLRLAPRDQADQRDIRYAFDADLTDVTSDQIVAGRDVSAPRLALRVDQDILTVEGNARVDGVDMDISFANPFDVPGSVLTAFFTLSQPFYDAFGIDLPPGMVSGATPGRLVVDLQRDAPPVFALTSTLRGATLRLPALSWGKSPEAVGSLVIAGALGDRPEITSLSLAANGLEAQGAITLRDGGGLERARFDRLKLGNWLNIAVDLLGRGPGQPVGIAVRGGSLDLSQSAFGGEGGDSGPMSVTLDRLQIARGFVLRDFAGQFDGAGGLNGRFTGLLNDAAPISGILAPFGGRSGVRVQSADAGTTLAASGLMQTAVGGALDLTLIPVAQPGHFDGTLRVTNLRVQEAPALASLLDAISVVGLLQQLDGQGLSFTEIDAAFRLAPDQITLTQSSAIGPGLGLSVDGVFDTARREMDFQGVISPLYLINGVGSVLTRPGEGLFGFNFTLGGTVGNARVGVNPLSLLTPGMFREIFRRPAPVVE